MNFPDASRPIERVEIRSRVAGAVQTVHFREGALVKQGDLLITIDPAPYAAEVERAHAQVTGAEARLALTKREHDRSQQLQQSGSGAISQSTIDQRLSAYREAEAALRAAEAALQTARLNLSYTDVKAPVAGRVGKLEITVGNLVAAGPGAPVLTTLVSVSPIYASFSADEEVVMRALKALTAEGHAHGNVERIPVRDDDGNQQRHDLQRQPAADRQPGRCQERHGPRARHIRQRAGPSDAGAVRAPAHGPAQDGPALAGQ